MSEFQPQTDSYMIESIYPYSIEIPEVITRISREITRNSTLIIKMIMLFQEEGASPPDLDYRVNRIMAKIQSQLELLETHYKADREEYDAITLELNKALLDRDALIVKRKINEIGDEEFSIKLSVEKWTIDDLKYKKRCLENSLKAIENLKGSLIFRDIDDIYRISMNNFQSLARLDLEPITKEKVIQILSKILIMITNSSPSTI